MDLLKTGENICVSHLSQQGIALQIIRQVAAWQWKYATKQELRFSELYKKMLHS